MPRTLRLPYVTLAALAWAGLVTTDAHSQSSTSVGFEGGTGTLSQGFVGNFVFQSTGGNPGRTARLQNIVPFPVLETGVVGVPANASFVRDYSQASQVTFSFDVKVDSLQSNAPGSPIERPIGIALIDREIQGANGPSGVFFQLSILSEAGQPDWTTLSMTIDDPASTTLPAGWVGFGDLDPNTAAPILPSGATFASVLASVDEFQVTGAVPGIVFSGASYDVRVDNLAVILDGGLGTPYCTAYPNSSGVIGITTAQGSRVVADNDVTLLAKQLPPSWFGIFVAGRTQASTSLLAGRLCLGGTIGRYQRPVEIFLIDQWGNASLTIDLTGIPEGGMLAPAVAGDTWNFQAWHRDFGANPGTAGLALPTSVTFI